MKIKAIANNVVKGATKALSKTKAKAIKNSPELLIASGVVGIVVGTVMACRATLKAKEVVEEAKNDISTIHECAENVEMKEKYSEDDKKKDMTIVYVKTAWNLTKLYAPCVGLCALSIYSIVMSNRIMRKRNAALLAAYSAIDKSFKDYRKRVIEKFGEKVDFEMQHGVKADKLEKEEKEIENQHIQMKNVYLTEDGNQITVSQYARFFDELADEWTKDAEYNLMFLRSTQNYFNDRLRAKGYVFLNEVYSALGLDETKAGQVVGWTYEIGNPDADGFIDFGIYDIHNPEKRAFVNGIERSILLDFNVDGPIIDLI